MQPCFANPLPSKHYIRVDKSGAIQYSEWPFQKVFLFFFSRCFRLSVFVLVVVVVSALRRLLLVVHMTHFRNYITYSETNFAISKTGSVMNRLFLKELFRAGSIGFAIAIAIAM